MEWPKSWFRASLWPTGAGIRNQIFLSTATNMWSGFWSHWFVRRDRVNRADQVARTCERFVYSSHNNKTVWLSNMTNTFTRCAKVCGLYYYNYYHLLCFRQTSISACFNCTGNLQHDLIVHFFSLFLKLTGRDAPFLRHFLLFFVVMNEGVAWRKGRKTSFH